MQVDESEETTQKKIQVRLLCCETSVIGNINNCINSTIFYQEDTYIIILEHKTEC